jgi:NitT/TauT family transport system substrate-binding protein
MFILRSVCSRVMSSIFLAAAIASTSTSLHAQDQPGKEQSATVGVFAGSLLSFPAFIAHERGFYKANGIDASLVPITTGPAMIAAVVSGGVVFANNSYDNLAIAVSKGLPLKAIVGNAVQLPFALIVRQGKPLPNKEKGYPKVMEDLVGSRMGVTTLGVSNHFLTEMLMADSGVSTKNTVYLGVGLPDSARPALKNKSVDTYTSLWPLPSIAEATGEATTVVNLSKGEGPASLKDLEYQGWWVTNKTLSERSDLVKRFVRATEQTYCWYKDPQNLDAVVAILRKHVPVAELNDEQYRRMIREQIGAYGVTIKESSIRRWQTILVAQKLIPRAFTYSELVAPVAPTESKCT